jgi:lysophospholipase L1-like esterase
MSADKTTVTPIPFRHLRDRFVTIVAFGDSLTQVNHWTYGNLNWVGLLPMGLYDVFPCGCTIINSGMSGSTMAHGLERLDRDVLRFSPDIVIISFGMNDSLNTTPEIFRAQLQQAIARIRAAGDARIILRTPNPMINMFTGRELNEFPGPDGDMRRTELAAFAEVIVEVSQTGDTLLVDHYTLWKQSMQSSCVGDMIMLMANPQHPNHVGHRRLYHELAPVFNAYRSFFHEWERILRDQNTIR